jgi:hypothetical protein
MRVDLETPKKIITQSFLVIAFVVNRRFDKAVTA